MAANPNQIYALNDPARDFVDRLVFLYLEANGPYGMANDFKNGAGIDIPHKSSFIHTISRDIVKYNLEIKTHGGVHKLYDLNEAAQNFVNRLVFLFVETHELEIVSADFAHFTHLNTNPRFLFDEVLKKDVFRYAGQYVRFVQYSGNQAHQPRQAHQPNANQQIPFFQHPFVNFQPNQNLNPNGISFYFPICPIVNSTGPLYFHGPTGNNIRPAGNNNNPGNNDG